MNRTEKLNVLSSILCGVDSVEDCLHCHGDKCIKFGNCKLKEKTDDQIEYILSSVDKCIYLEACAGSGKTEVLGIKAAYEISRWNLKNSGIAVLTFTNDATTTIVERVSMFYNRPISSRHFIGTFSSFIHGYISQKFGYKFFQDKTTEKDKSFCVVDAKISHYNNSWLRNYSIRFPHPNYSHIYASQLSFRCGVRDLFINDGREPTSFKSLYDSVQAQELIKSLRNKKHNAYLYTYEYLFNRATKCKSEFWKDGFANFEDMNIIAIRCLKDSGIRTYLSKKFPLILVDECQDLSKNELIILALLIKAGTKLHYIGDLHQAIYSFKDACPEHYTAHINKHGFETMNLIDNFRSTQKIVDVSRNIASISNQIAGRIESEYNGEDCFYIEYIEEKDAIHTFEHLLKNRGIKIKDAVVLVRTQDAKAKLTKNNNSDYNKHTIISAMQLWKSNTPRGKKEALQLLGGQLQKWLGFQGRSNNFYYPPDLCSDAVAWRLMLRDILSNLCADEFICNLNDITYSDWYRNNKKQIAYIINSYTHKMIGLDLSADVLKAPSGTAKLAIEKIEEKPITGIKVETVHAVKGRTFDAVLLLSSPDARGKTGYWGNWLNPGDEASRIGYVACTRPKSLLCWGVSTLNDTQRRTIENLGLKKYQS